MLNENLSGLRQKKNSRSSRNGQAPEMFKAHRTHEQATIGHHIRPQRRHPFFSILAHVVQRKSRVYQILSSSKKQNIN